MGVDETDGEMSGVGVYHVKFTKNQQKILKLIFYFYVHGCFPMHVFVYHTQIRQHEGEKIAPDPLELKLQ